MAKNAWTSNERAAESKRTIKWRMASGVMRSPKCTFEYVDEFGMMCWRIWMLSKNYLADILCSSSNQCESRMCVRRRQWLNFVSKCFNECEKWFPSKWTSVGRRAKQQQSFMYLEVSLDDECAIERCSIPFSAENFACISLVLPWIMCWIILMCSFGSRRIQYACAKGGSIYFNVHAN